MASRLKGWLEKNKDPLNDTVRIETTTRISTARKLQVVNVLKGNEGQALLSEIFSNYATQAR